MDAKARSAWSVIRRCLVADRYRLLAHFRQRLAERGLLWADVLTVIDQPRTVRDGARDRFGRPKWIIGGTAADGLDLEMVCVLDTDDHGAVTVFITIY